VLVRGQVEEFAIQVKAYGKSIVPPAERKHTQTGPNEFLSYWIGEKPRPDA
jgi:hypothetical protein